MWDYWIMAVEWLFAWGYWAIEWVFEYAVATPLGYAAVNYPRALYVAAWMTIVYAIVRAAASVVIAVLTPCFGARRARDAVASGIMLAAVYGAYKQWMDLAP